MFLLPFGLLVNHGATATSWLTSELIPESFSSQTLASLINDLVPGHHSVGDWRRGAAAIASDERCR
jgi:hypothetical protein